MSYNWFFVPVTSSRYSRQTCQVWCWPWRGRAVIDKAWNQTNWMFSIIKEREKRTSPWKLVKWVHACVHAHLLSHVRLFCNLMDCRPPGSSVHGISQTRVLEWVAISSSRGSFRPRDGIQVFGASCIGRWIFYHWATREALSGYREEEKRKGKCSVTGVGANDPPSYGEKAEDRPPPTSRLCEVFRSLDSENHPYNSLRSTQQAGRDVY